MIFNKTKQNIDHEIINYWIQYQNVTILSQNPYYLAQVVAWSVLRNKQHIQRKFHKLIVSIKIVIICYVLNKTAKKSIQRIIELFTRHGDGFWFGNTQWCNHFYFVCELFVRSLTRRSNNSSLCIVCPLCFHNYLFFGFVSSKRHFVRLNVDPLAMPNKNEQHFCRNSRDNIIVSFSLNVIHFPKTQESNRKLLHKAWKARRRKSATERRSKCTQYRTVGLGLKRFVFPWNFLIPCVLYVP